MIYCHIYFKYFESFCGNEVILSNGVIPAFPSSLWSIDWFALGAFHKQVSPSPAHVKNNEALIGLGAIEEYIYILLKMMVTKIYLKLKSIGNVYINILFILWIIDIYIYFIFKTNFVHLNKPFPWDESMYEDYIQSLLILH